MPKEYKKPKPSVVAIVEAPDVFVAERRPDLPGKLAYPGKIGLLGGGVELGETQEAAIRRELGEETTLEADVLPVVPLWEGPYVGEGTDGLPIDRYVGVFGVQVEDINFGLRVQGELVHIPKEVQALEMRAEEMTPFALHALRVALGEESWD
jgi:8-oxo-dGTP pyrophosphatase MutT (NUDIX family)